MSDLDDFELKSRRLKLMVQYQQYQASVNNTNSGNFGTKCSPSLQAIGRMAGRSVTPINDTNSKESKLYQTHLLCTIEDQVRSNYVNTVKKSESNLMKGKCL